MSRSLLFAHCSERPAPPRYQGAEHNENYTQRTPNSSHPRYDSQEERRGGFNSGRGRPNTIEGGRYEGERAFRGRGDHRGGTNIRMQSTGFDRSDFVSNTGGYGNRGGRDDYSDRYANHGSPSNPNGNESRPTFSGFSGARAPVVNFEAGDRFVECDIPKETFKFVISHIQTANDFFIQMKSKEIELTKLTEALQTEYKLSPGIDANSLRFKQPCLAKSNDNYWYRGTSRRKCISSHLVLRSRSNGPINEQDSNQGWFHGFW